MKLHPPVTALTVVLVAALGLTPTLAEEAATKAEEPSPSVSPYMAATEAAQQRRAIGDAKVITNEDLARLASSSRSPFPMTASPPVAPDTPDAPKVMAPLDYMRAKEARQVEQGQERAAGAEALSAARQRVTDLENRLKGFRSPFKAYPSKPDEDPGWDTQSTAERIAATEAELAEARSALRVAEQNAGSSTRRP